MTPEHITTLSSGGESATLELKTTTGTRREAAMTVCAFLHQGRGQVLLEGAVAQVKQATKGSHRV